MASKLFPNAFNNRDPKKFGMENVCKNLITMVVFCKLDGFTPYINMKDYGYEFYGFMDSTKVSNRLSAFRHFFSLKCHFLMPKRIFLFLVKK